MEHAIAPFKGTGPPLPLCPLRVRLFLLETASLLWMTSVGISIRHGPICLAPPREKTLLINSPGPVQWTQAPVPGCARQSLGTWGLGKDFHPGRQCKQLLAEKSSPGGHFCLATILKPGIPCSIISSLSTPFKSFDHTIGYLTCCFLHRSKKQK